MIRSNARTVVLRPRTDDVRTVAREHTQEAVARLVEWMRGDDAKISMAAAAALLDRAWGKASTGADGEEPDERPSLGRIERVIVDPADPDA